MDLREKLMSAINESRDEYYSNNGSSSRQSGSGFGFGSNRSTFNDPANNMWQNNAPGSASNFNNYNVPPPAWDQSSARNQFPNNGQNPRSNFRQDNNQAFGGNNSSQGYGAGPSQNSNNNQTDGNLAALIAEAVSKTLQNHLGPGMGSVDPSVIDDIRDRVSKSFNKDAGGSARSNNVSIPIFIK